MTLDIYFGAKICGGNPNLANCRLIVNTLRKYGNVLTEHVVLDDVESFEQDWYRKHPGDNTFLRDMRWLRQSKFFVGEYSGPSTGLGYETREAINLGIPILCLHLLETIPTRLITQNDSPLVEVCTYNDRDILSIESAVRGFMLRRRLI